MKKSLLFTLLATIFCFAAQAQSPASYMTSWFKSRSNQTILRSPNGNYNLIYQGDGKLCLYNKAGAPIWATMTNGKQSSTVRFQDDGNLVIYHGNTPIWGAECHGKGGKYIVLQDDGNLVIYTQDNRPIWATMTNGR